MQQSCTHWPRQWFLSSEQGCEGGGGGGGEGRGGERGGGGKGQDHNYNAISHSNAAELYSCPRKLLLSSKQGRREEKVGQKGGEPKKTGICWLFNSVPSGCPYGRVCIFIHHCNNCGAVNTTGWCVLFLRNGLVTEGGTTKEHKLRSFLPVHDVVYLSVKVYMASWIFMHVK